MNAFLLLYALTISIELMLSLLMAIFLYLILAPPGNRRENTRTLGNDTARPLAGAVGTALLDAFASVSTDGNDLATITNARTLLIRYARDRADSTARSR